MSKPNILGPEINNLLDKWYKEHQEVLECQDVMTFLDNEGIKYSPSSVNVYISKWRSQNGLKKRRGRKPKTEIINENENDFSRIERIPESLFSKILSNGKRTYKVISENRNTVELENGHSLVFETTKRNLERYGYQEIS